MAEQRHVSRPTSVIIEAVSGDDRVLRFEAKPLPWRARNDLGDLVVQQYLTALNEGITAIGEGKDARLMGKMMEAIIEYDKLFIAAYPNGSIKDFEELSFAQVLEVLGAALDVNMLTSQRHMIDPNIPTPNRENRDGENTDGEKITSMDGSSSPELELVK